jgi:hypothetical protein
MAGIDAKRPFWRREKRRRSFRQSGAGVPHFADDFDKSSRNAGNSFNGGIRSVDDPATIGFMGGWGSGQRSGRPATDEALVIDLTRMLRMGLLRQGQSRTGKLKLANRSGHSSVIGYRYDLTNPQDASLALKYRIRGSDGEWETRLQRIRLIYTVPHYGGRRWWMECPESAVRVLKLYLPAGGTLFASRTTWGLTYRSQRNTRRDRAFERLFALQRRLGCPEEWGQPISRPKGMWRRTYERLQRHYRDLDAECLERVIRDIEPFRSRISP